MDVFKKITYCIGIAAVCALSACNKTNNGTPISADLKKYFDYKVGTYWIMRDSISGRVDSFFVKSNQFVGFVQGNNNNEINILIYEYTNGEINSDSLQWIVTLSSNDFYLDIGSPNPFYVTNGASLFSFPFTPNSHLNILPSYTLMGNTYTDVAQIYFNAGSPAWYYINNDVGFIKIRLSSTLVNISYVWELQRYNLIF